MDTITSLVSTISLTQLLAATAAFSATLFAYTVRSIFSNKKELALAIAEHERLVGLSEIYVKKGDRIVVIPDDPSQIMKGFTKKLPSDDRPPRAGRLLVRFLISYKAQEPLLGDLAELHKKVLAEEGQKAASAFYISQVVRSIFAQFKQFGIVAMISEFLRRITP